MYNASVFMIHLIVNYTHIIKIYFQLTGTITFQMNYKINIYIYKQKNIYENSKFTLINYDALCSKSLSLIIQ